MVGRLTGRVIASFGLPFLTLLQAAFGVACFAADLPAVSTKGPSSIEAVRREADLGKSPAQCRLAEHYFARADYTNAVIWYRRAAEQGEVEAGISLAACYA